MPRCSRCTLEKPAEDFAWRRKDKGWRDTYCRPCRAAYKKEHYAKNKQRYLQQGEDWTKKVLAERGPELLEFFRTHPCSDCGESDPIVLEFDHLKDKRFNVGAGFRDRNWAQVLLEMEKCDVVCVNCHRRRTARRSKSQRFLALKRMRATRGQTGPR